MLPLFVSLIQLIGDSMNKKYTVLKSFKGSPDGMAVISYEEGDVVPCEGKPMSEDLAGVALKEKWIKKGAKAQAKKKEEKKPEPAVRPENQKDLTVAIQSAINDLHKKAGLVGSIKNLFSAEKSRVEEIVEILGYEVSEEEINTAAESMDSSSEE